MEYIVKIEDTIIKSFYMEEVHGKEKCDEILEAGGIKINEELWNHLLQNDKKKFVSTEVKEVYTMEDVAMFSVIEEQPDDTVYPPSLEQRVTALESALLEVLQRV